MTPSHPQTFFATAMAFGRWLERHHASQRELWVGYWKKHTGKASMDWAQSVREALRVGWIDGVRRTLDDKAYVVRFTPRMPTSVWSAVNIRIAEDLFAEGQMLPAGLAVFVNRHRHDKSGDTSSDRPGRLPPTMQRRLRADPAAWAFWQSQPAGYRRSAVHGVLAVKRDENREKRLAQLIAGSAAGRRLGVMAVTPRRG